MRKCLLIVAIYLTCSIPDIVAQNYSVASIPDNLKDNAHSVIREYLQEIELQSVNKGVERIRKVMTILRQSR